MRLRERNFSSSFIGMGIDDAFEVGVDVEVIEGHAAAANAVALLPKKTLVMSYALLLKRASKPAPEEKTPEPDRPAEMPEEDMPEVEDPQSPHDVDDRRLFCCR